MTVTYSILETSRNTLRLHIHAGKAGVQIAPDRGVLEFAQFLAVPSKSQACN